MKSLKSNKVYVRTKETIDYLVSLLLIASNKIYTLIEIASLQYPKYTFTNKYHLVNNDFLLQYLKKTFFTEKDARAGWFGPALPYTNNKKYKPFATLALIHLHMYLTCFPFILKEKSKILDIGCGIGYATVCMADNWPEAKITGIDYDSEAIGFARKVNNKPNITYINNDFLTYHSNEKFDYIFVIDIFEHIPPNKHDTFIDHCLSFLKKDGLLFLITPNAVNEKDADHTHIGMLNKDRMKLLLKKYKSHFYDEAFLIDKYLEGGDPKKIIIKKPLAMFEKFQKKDQINYSSHIRLIMKK